MSSPLSAHSTNSGLDFDSVDALEKSESVAILMCSFNGERFLSEQLASIEQQDHVRWRLYVSDDGSTDSTLSILDAFQARLGSEKVTVFSGPRTGFASNFMSVTCKKEINADFFAWSDQDDVWACDKLTAALTWLRQVPADVPALYAARTTLVNEDGVTIGVTPRYSRAFGFSNALVQNIAAGNTMVFNRAACEILRSTAHLNIVAHDWWAYLLVTGAGGVFHFDEAPHLFYRQHEANSIGASRGFGSTVIRIRKLFQGRLRRWIDQNIENLESVEFLLAPQNREVLQRFKIARKRNLPGRLFGIWRSGIYRQTLMGNLGLLIAVISRGV
ncbi:glycosyltransferase family 2 protein [Pseudomonas hamedanensis]|uniref:Glycosyltransferase family 2 protein n=1 Tax=Pseudomonas hamedanensis TaxID=2745504 RepID=A0A9E6TFV0_9PSED|nr:glycosyltransferase family 2 protein [Pseudomonas hamedanensis]QXI16358.1 glycosyltransferase family 2 protein [Pseudomonas hamedanensis]